MDKLEEIKNKISAFQAKSAAKDEIQAFITLAVGVLKKYKDTFDSISSENLSQVREVINDLEAKRGEILLDVDGKTTRATKDFDKKLKEVRDLLDEIKSIEVRDGVDGKDADEEKIINEVLSKIPPVPEVILDDGLEIVDKINNSDVKIQWDKVDLSRIEKYIKDVEEIAKHNSVPPTTSLINGRRAKNLNFVGATVSYRDDAATVTITGGSGSITGTDTQILFFDGNDNPSGDAGLTYNKTTDTVSLINIKNISGNTLSIATLSGASPSPINIESGNATSGNTAGAHLLLRSGEGFGSGAGGTLYLSGNTGGATGDGGVVQINGGAGGATGGNGANVTITSGSAQAGDGNAGDIILTTGNPDGAGDVGTINLVDSSLATANNGYLWTLTDDVTGAGAWTINSAVPYTGATDDVDLGAHSITATAVIWEETNGLGDLITIIAPASIADSYTLTLPVDAGTSGYVLQTNGGGGELSWKHVVDGTGTSNEIAYFVDSDTIGSLAVATYPSLTELTYVKGVTSAIQTQLNAKLASSDYDDATAAETTTGTSTTKYVSPDGLAGSDYGKRVVNILVSDPLGSAITTGDGKACFRVPSVMNGWNLVGVAGSLSTVSSSGLPTFQVRRSRRSTATTRSDADMLSTKLSIDASEFDSVDATTAVVINTANDDVNTGDNIYIDIDVAGTGAKGLVAELIFQLP